MNLFDDSPADDRVDMITAVYYGDKFDGIQSTYVHYRRGLDHVDSEEYLPLANYWLNRLTPGCEVKNGIFS